MDDYVVLLSFDDMDSLYSYRIGSRRISGSKTSNHYSVEDLEQATKAAQHESRPFILFGVVDGKRESLVDIKDARALLLGVRTIVARVYQSGMSAWLRLGQLGADIPITSQKGVAVVEVLVSEYRDGKFNHATVRYFQGDSPEPMSHLEQMRKFKHLPAE